MPDLGLPVQIIKGATFTTARVGGQIVAVKWSAGTAAHFVTAGLGPAATYDNEREAMKSFMDIAIGATGGVATVAIHDEHQHDTRPQPRSEHRCEQPAKCWADPDCPVYSSRGAGGQPTTTTAPYAGGEPR